MLVAVSCANMAPLAGGPKDEKAPVLLNTTPADNSRNFSGDRVTFYFDEFIQLKNAQQKLLVSPPMNEAPELRAKNRELTVVFKSQPEPNTTYTLNFGDAIADLNEGNSIQNFIFTFSTGSTADSLKASGRVINSFTLEPEKNVSVFLYNTKRDSLPYVAVPYYVTRTDNMGYFNFINVKEGFYHIKKSLPAPAGGINLKNIPSIKDFYGKDVVILIGASLYLKSSNLEKTVRDIISKFN